MDEQITSELELTIAEQAREIEALKAKLAPRTASRRSVLKGAGAMAGGLAAIGAMSAAGSALTATPAGAAGWETPPTYPGAQSVALFLKLNAVAIPGDNRNTQDGRAGSIECVYFQYAVTNSITTRTGAASGRRTHDPIVIRKPIDQSSPLLFKGLVTNQVVDAQFRFYRLGDDSENHNFYTIEISQGRIAAVNEISPDNENLGGAGATSFPMEQVSFVFHTIKWRFEPTATEFEDTVNPRS